MVKLSLEAFESVRFKGKKYKVVETVKSQRKADMVASEWEGRIRSKRFPVIIKRIPIGLGLGCRFKICIPEGMEK